MSSIEFQAWVEQNPILALSGIILLSAVIFVIARSIIARGLIAISARTKTRIDDILVQHLKPFRVAWLAPLTAIYFFAYMLPAYQTIIEKAALFLILWVSIVTLSAMLSAANEIYETRKSFSGVSIQGYLDIAKLLFAVIGVIISITLITGESPVVLLTGLGALTAVLLLIFQDTILALVASIQIGANDLIKEGDWIEVPSYGADGDVVNISLYAIRIRNSDMTYTVIPTYKIVDVAYKNWRGVKDSGGRRIQRSISVDMVSIKFCDQALLDKLHKIDLIKDYLDQRIQCLDAYHKEHQDHFDSPLDGPQITNIEVFRSYIVAYLRNRPDIHQDGMPFLVRALAPHTTGIPIEVYIFTCTTVWEQYELIQAEIFDHILASASYFDLRVFQEPTGLDFSTFAKRLAS